MTASAQHRLGSPDHQPISGGGGGRFRARSAVAGLCAALLVAGVGAFALLRPPLRAPALYRELHGHTWYLQSVTRLGRTWIPDAVASVTAPSQGRLVTDDGANTTQWSIHYSGAILSLHQGESSTVGETAANLELETAFDDVLSHHPVAVLTPGHLQLARGNDAVLRLSTTRPVPAAQGNLALTVAPSAAGARLALDDADGLRLWQQTAAQATGPLGFPPGRYRLTAQADGLACTNAPVTVRPGRTTVVAVSCHPGG